MNKMDYQILHDLATHERDVARDAVRVLMTWSFCPYCGQYPKSHLKTCPGPRIRQQAIDSLKDATE